MKKRRRKRGRKRINKTASKEQPVVEHPSLPVSISIQKSWVSKEDNSPIDFGEVFAACIIGVDQEGMELYDQQGNLPFLLTEDDDQGCTVYFCVTGVEALDYFFMAQVVDIDSEDGQQVVKEMEAFKDILISTGRPEDAVSDAIAAMFRCEEDKVRVNLIVGSASDNVLRDTLDAGKVDEDDWRGLPPIPITAFQQVFESFLSYLLGETVINGTPDADISFAGDRRWLVQGGELDTFMQRWEASRVMTV